MANALTVYSIYPTLAHPIHSGAPSPRIHHPAPPTQTTGVPTIDLLQHLLSARRHPPATPAPTFLIQWCLCPYQRRAVTTTPPL
ncbi:hypothetical protein U1Q18_042728, partial [Sarracenia purpurea var. burkii]